MSRISPTKFLTLPEDLQVRLIRKGVGLLNKRQQYLTLKERIVDAGTQPFTLGEVEWLITVQSHFMLFFGYNETATLQIFTRVTTVGRSQRLLSEPQFITDDKVLRIKIDRTGLVTYTFEPKDRPVKQNDFIDLLIDRLDTNQLFSSDKILSHHGNVVPANVVLTDIRCIFMVLLERFLIIDDTQALPRTRYWTQKALNNIVDDYQGAKLPALMGYLLYNLMQQPPRSAVMALGKEIKLSDYIATGKVPLTVNYVKELQDKCTILYELLVTMISKME